MTHHNQNNRQHYLRAKEMAYQMLQGVSFYVAEENGQQSVGRLQEIVREVGKADERERGEVYLIVCMTIIQLHFAKICDLLPKDYSLCIQTYLVSLLQPKKQTKIHNSSASDIYAGKLKKSKHVVEEKKRKFMDWLFVERIDRVLAAIARETEQEFTTFKGFQKTIREQLSKSLTLAKTIFSERDYLQYRNNIETIIAVKEKPAMASERARPNNQGKLIIIDETLITHKQTSLTVRKNSFGRILPSFKNSFKYKLQKTTSINEAIDSSRKNQEEKKHSTIHRSSKRGSLSSNCSKRSSTFFNKSQEKQLGPRVSTRWGNKINIEVVASSFNKNRPFRRSNFQQIRSKQLQFVERQESTLFFKKHSSIIQEQVCPQKQMEATIHNLFIDGFLKSLRKMKEFYIFLQVEGTTYLASIQELKQHEIVDEEQDRNQEHFRVRVKVMNNNRSMFVLIFPSFNRGSLSKELTCLKIITELAYFYRNDLRIIRADTSDGTNFELSQDQETHQNIFRVSTSSERILMGFIRKISTYFICICKYQIQEIGGYNQHDFRRRMLEEGRTLKKNISAQRQLKSTDLTLDFRIEPASSIKKGSVITYIEKQDDQPQDQQLYKDGCPIKIVQNTVKQMLEVPIKILWENSLHRHKKQKEKTRRQHRKGTTSKIQKFIDRQPQTKRLKRVGLNKNSIKMMSYVNDFQGGGFPQHEFFKSHQNQNRNYSRKQINQSQKKIQQKVQKHPVRQLKTQKTSKKRHFIESIKTDKGYQLILHSETQQITGCKYQSYFGYKQRNPKHCCYYKQGTSVSLNRDNFYKPTLSIHGNKKRNIQSTSLITFTKMINSQQGFQGYVVSNIKILPNSVNSDIFVETYWQAKQKYFVFVVSSDVFEKLTDINTKSFEEKPFLASSQVQQISKKRDKRTSVVASLMKDREVELLKQSSSKLKRNRFFPEESSMEIQQVNESFSREHSKRKHDFKTLTSNQMQTMGRVIKTVDTCSTSKHMKTSLKSEAAALKRQVVARLRNKIVKYANFVWKNYRLYFQLKYNIPTQLDSINIVEFQGSQLALKNAYSNPRTPSQLQGTQLILVKYSENSLANLNFYSMQGLNKIYLQHVFIKNSSDLCGRYTASISIRQLIQDQRLSINYKHNNNFFEHKVETFKLSINYLRSYTSKPSTLDDQRKLKYQEILEMAKKCSIPISCIHKKKKSIMARKFIVPNRYEYFQSEDYLLQVQIHDQELIIKNLQNKVLLVINIDKLQKIIQFARKWPLKTFTKAIAHRILKDEELLNLCSDKQT